MRVFAWISLVIGVVSLFVACALLIGNDDLALGGPSLLPDALSGNWRLLLGPAIWVAALGLSTSWIAFRRLPGLAWLALLVLALLLLVYLAVGLVPSMGIAVVAVIVGGILVPAVVAAIASAIGHAVAQRRTAEVSRPA